MSHDRVLVIDLETSGGDENRDRLLEVGALLCGPLPELAEIGRFQAIIHTPSWVRDSADLVVREMHDANGLWEEASVSLSTVDRVDAGICAWLDSHGVGDKVPLAGSGVTHFDRRWISRWLPRLSERCTYWGYDSGVLRRFLEAVGAAHAVPKLNAEKTHRALGDARLHAEELRHYAGLFVAVEQKLQQVAAQLGVTDAS